MDSFSLQRLKKAPRLDTCCIAQILILIYFTPLRPQMFFFHSPGMRNN